MRLPCLLRFVFCLYCCCCSLSLLAAGPQQALQQAIQQPSQQPVQQLCQLSGQPCLDAVEPELAGAKKYSLYWYQLTLYKLDSLYELQKDDELFALSSQLVADKQLERKSPPHFRARLYIYFAKLLYSKQNKQASNVYLQQATQLLASLHQADFNPFTMLLLINVQMYTDTNDETGYASLLELETQYRKSKDPVFLYELYNNLGHYSHRLKLLHKSVEHRKKALAAIQGTNQTVRIAEANYNLARILAYTDQWAETLPHLRAAERLYLSEGYEVVHNLAILHQAEALWHTGQPELARLQYHKVKLSLVPDYAQVHLTRIQALLGVTADLVPAKTSNNPSPE